MLTRERQTSRALVAHGFKKLKGLLSMNSWAAAFDPESMHPTRTAAGATEREAAYDAWLAVEDVGMGMPRATEPAALSADGDRRVAGMGLNVPLHRPDHGHRTPAVWHDNNTPAVGAVPGLLHPHEPQRALHSHDRQVGRGKLAHDRPLAAKPGASHWHADSTPAAGALQALQPYAPKPHPCAPRYMLQPMHHSGRQARPAWLVHTPSRTRQARGLCRTGP